MTPFIVPGGTGWDKLGHRFQNALLGVWLIATVAGAGLLAWEIVNIVAWYLR